MSPITNSSDPLQPGESLFRECELGLDKEVIDYILENHDLQIKIGGEPFYLYQRMSSGSAVTGTITSWDDTSSQYMKILWSPGDSNHPDLRRYIDEGAGTFCLYEDGVSLTRVFDKGDLLEDNEFALEEIVGTSVSTKDQVKLWLNPGYVPSGVITYEYKVVCSCVDFSTNQPDMNCKLCYGTGFPIGWVKYTCDGTKYNATNTIIVRVPRTAFKYTFDGEGMVKREMNKLWTLRVPRVYNYDLVLGTIGKSESRLYEVVNKTDSYLRGVFMHQEFEIILLEERDVRYRMIEAL